MDIIRSSLKKKKSSFFVDYRNEAYIKPNIKKSSLLLQTWQELSLCGTNAKIYSIGLRGRRGSWSYGSWIYNYLCNQCLSPLMLWVRISLRQGVLNTTLYDKVCQLLEAVWWFSLGTPVSSTNKMIAKI